MSSFVVWSHLNTAKQESLCPCRSNEQKAGHNIYKTFPVAFTPAPSWSSKPDGSWYIAWENSWHFATPPLGSACFWLVEGYFQFSTNQKHLLDLGSDWPVIDMECWKLVSRTSFRGKTLSSREISVGCFLRLVDTQIYSYINGSHFTDLWKTIQLE